MYFPEFAGKSYKFIIFQGSEQKTIYNEIIPKDGKFSLSIPMDYAPYKGMSRWLITGTEEGGGLDMYIPGKNFSVSCKAKHPNEENIIYKDNLGNNELNELYRTQERIINRYEVMLNAKNLYTRGDKNFPVFVDEYEKQKKDYDIFQEKLKNTGGYISQFTMIVNITKGIGNRLYEKEYDRAENIAAYILHDLDWNVLYTSGHWWSVLRAWVSIHTRVIRDHERFVTDFKSISSKLTTDQQYTDFASRIAYFLNDEGKEEYIKDIAPLVINSKRVDAYNGALELYLKYK
ncbi:alkyl hydroperoxide reductase [Elizabethkingia meningoseptica]|nr:alkyl hydroperoxide reductase [Elizabethkingia meningoseptica]